MATNNTFLTPEIIAMEALYQLEKTRVLTSLVNTNYSKDFNRVGDTVNVRKPAVLYGKAFKGNVKRQDATEGSVPVKLDRIADVSVAVSSKELSLKIADFGQQLLVPAVRGLNDKIDSDIASFIYDMAQKRIDATNTGLKDIADIGKYFDNQKAPTADRNIVFSPDHKYVYAQAENLSKVSYAGTSDTLREALLGRIYGNDTFMSQNVPYSYAITPGTATDYKVEAIAGQHAVKLTSVTAATATVKAGDGFIFKGILYRFDEDATASAGAIASVALHPASEEFPEATAQTVRLLPAVSSIAFHKDAVTLATRPLETPLGGASSHTAIGENFSIRVTFDYDSNTKENLISLDVLYGISKLHDNLAVTLVG